MNRRILALVAAAGLCLAQPKPHARPSAPWIQSSVIYELNTRTFSKEGNFRGIEARLGDLKSLGVDVLWLMPIYPTGEKLKKGTLGSPYSVRDYYAINPDYGTADDLKRLVRQAHNKGLRIILDTVPNHTSWDNALLRDKSFFKRDAEGNVVPPNADWNDVAGLDYSNPKVRDYMDGVYRYWLKEFDLDGFRCDVAFGPPAEFWNHLRPQLDAIKPDILMLAEANVPQLLEQAFDLDYAWPFHSTLTEVFENGEAAEALRKNWFDQRSRYPLGAMEMRFSDDHDEKRAIARFGEKGALAASALVFTLDGVPLLYNGMEAGDVTESGGPALFEPLKVVWQMAERRPEFPRFYREMIALRRAHAALQQGETVWIDNSDPARLLSYMRKAEGEEFLVLINTTNRPLYGTVSLAAGNWTDVTPGIAGGQHTTPAIPIVTLEAWGYRVYQRR